jgi:DNA invertase Pin-like site-specific DNA recombinase
MTTDTITVARGSNNVALHRPHLRAGWVNPALVAGRKPRAAILGRKSHATEGKSKSVKEQVDECRQVCELMGFEVSDERMYVEPDGTKGSWFWPESGKPGPHRPVLGRLVQDILDGLVDVVVIWRSDRLYRDVGLANDLLNLMVQHNVRLVASRHDYNIHTATGLANAKQEAVRNEEMLGKTSEDIIRDLQFKRAIGQITRSPACLGFRSAGNDSCAAVVVPEEIALVQRIFRMYVVGEDERGPLSRHAIALQLMGEGVKFPRLRRKDKGEHLDSIDGDRIERVLQHVAYIGKMNHAGEVYDCNQLLVSAADGSDRKETVVPLSLWQEANERIDRETKADKRRKPGEAPHLLTGTVVCGRCGRNCYAVGGYERQGVMMSFSRFICTNRYGNNKCPRDAGRRAPQEAVLEAWVFEELFPLLAAEIEASQASAGRDAETQRLAALRREIEEAQRSEGRKLRRALDAVDSGGMDQHQYNQLATDLRAEREAMGREAEALAKRLSQAAPVIPDVSAAALARMPRSTVRAAVRAALDWIAICPEGIVAKSRWGTYTAARFRQGRRDAGEHHSIVFISKATAVDSLEALSLLPDPQRFLEGRRHTLGDAAVAVLDEHILPGYRVRQEGEVWGDHEGEYLLDLGEIALTDPIGGDGREDT